MALNGAAFGAEQLRRLIQRLETMRGHGTSLISLFVSPNDQITRFSQLLHVEMDTASNIRSQFNRLLVIGAITSTLNHLQRYASRAPVNGLVIYCGSVVTAEGQEDINIAFEPFRPISNSFYLCDDRFHTEALNELLG